MNLFLFFLFEDFFFPQSFYKLRIYMGSEQSGAKIMHLICTMIWASLLVCLIKPFQISLKAFIIASAVNSVVLCMQFTVFVISPFFVGQNKAAIFQSYNNFKLAFFCHCHIFLKPHIVCTAFVGFLVVDLM